MTKQREILDLTRETLPDILLCNGPTGSGKSLVCNLKWYEILLSGQEGDQFLLTGNTSETLTKNVIVDLISFDSSYRYLSFRKSPASITTTGGAVCYCIGVNNEGGERRVRGGSIRAWYGDEVTTYPQSAFDQCLARCRWVTDGTLRVTPTILTCNADSPGHFVKKEIIDKADERGAKIYYFTFEDNPTITPSYIAQVKKRFHGVFYERMIMNRWVSAEGAIYDMFSRATHVIDKPLYPIVRYTWGVDWGYTNPMAIVLIGHDSDGRRYVVKELYERNVVIGDAFEATLSNNGFLDFGADIYSDPSRPESVIQLQNILSKYTERGKSFRVYPGENDVIQGIQSVQRAMSLRGDGTYGLYVLSSCTETINEIESYHWKKTKDGTRDEPEKTADHLCDACRYECFTTRNTYNFGAVGTLEGSG